LRPDQVILEARGRNTAASVALAALAVERRAGDGVMVVMPSDHWIAPRRGFLRTVAAAVQAVRRAPVLATIGLPATAPETGFGYIRPARRTAPGRVAAVAGFIEKPSRAVARRLVASRRHLWNSGIFVWRASTVLGALDRHAPAIARGARRATLRRTGSGYAVGARAMARIPAEPIDRAVLERSHDLVVARADFRWSDLGNWGSVLEALKHDGAGARLRGTRLLVDARGCEAVNPAGLTVFLGVEDLIVVRDGDSILVCRRDRPQEVRRIPALLKGRWARYA
jgi:mannose-1-phosphate guanylyltransferase